MKKTTLFFLCLFFPLTHFAQQRLEQKEKRYEYPIYKKQEPEWLVPPTLEYDYVSVFSEGLATVRIGNHENGKWGFVDKTGKVVIKIKYDFVEDFERGLAKVKLNGKYGFIDKRGKKIYPIKYESIDIKYFSEDLSILNLNGKIWLY